MPSQRCPTLSGLLTTSVEQKIIFHFSRWFAITANLFQIWWPLCILWMNSYKPLWSGIGLSIASKPSKWLKDHQSSTQVLTHYNPALPIDLAAGASAYGVGAVISHMLPDGTKCPIAYTSHTVFSSEHNYAQPKRKALALILGVKRFHQYINGHKFTMITNHKPLMPIFDPKKGIPFLAATIFNSNLL